MIDFLKKLFGGGAPVGGQTTPVATPRADQKPPLPQADLDAFKAWFLAQRRPAIALVPDAGASIQASGSRLGGPVWLAEGEAWPTDPRGAPLEFVAQLDLADCAGLHGYPEGGVVHFFVARDDLYGADFDDPSRGVRLVRRVDPATPGALHPPPPLVEILGVPLSDCSPFQNDDTRENGIALRPELFEDRIDGSIRDTNARIDVLYRQGWDLETLYDFLDSDAVARPMRHHSGGYPAYTQNDVHGIPAFEPYDHVLLRLTSDDHIMWGDVGECVFLIRSVDLAAGVFDDVAYSWDCH